MQRENGNIIVWSDELGSGLIRPTKSAKDVYLYAVNFRSSQRSPRMHDHVTYILDESDIGKPRALDVIICRFALSFFALLCLSVLPFLGVYIYCVWQHLLPFRPIALVYVGMSLITVSLYHHDKNASKMGAWRVSEKDLHLLELFGGWPGAFLAQLFFCHKLKNLSYQVTFWLIVMVHGLGWLSVSYGSQVFQSVKELPVIIVSDIVKDIQKAAIVSNTLDLIANKSEPEAFPNTPSPDASAPAPHKQEPAAASPSTPAPSPVEVIWTNETPTEPLIIDPTVRRSLASAPEQLRRLTGEVKAVSPSHGLLISLPLETEGEGTIDPSCLIADFHRRFRVGEQVTVAIQRISIRGSEKRVDLLLVEP